MAWMTCGPRAQHQRSTAAESLHRKESQRGGMDGMELSLSCLIGNIFDAVSEDKVAGVQQRLSYARQHLPWLRLRIKR
eukprot:1160456-Pelagomonas_calceolata.AAC.2